jgi:predicted metal-dependent hydrolase
MLAMKIIRSKRRSLSLIVTEEAELIVRAPHRLPQFELERIINQKRDWIEQKLAEATRRPKPVLIPVEAEQELQWQAFEVLKRRVAHYAALTGYQPTAVKISRARRRWGSCSPNGTVHFNWRLVRAPEAVLDYVIVHELAHLAERNHSSRFWRRVAAIIPDHRRHRKWLKDNSHLLPA